MGRVTSDVSMSLDGFILKAGLLDEMQIQLIPMLLGDGIRLFDDLDPEAIELRRTSSIETPGATHFRFEVVK
jgi:dihydrofolate reductase